MANIELPWIDRERGLIVSNINVNSFSAGTGWYVHFIPDKEHTHYGRWRQSDRLTKWCDSELVKLPDEKVPENADREWLLGVIEEMLVEDGLSGCKRCGTCVPAGELVTASGSYVAAICRECKGVCTECGANDWEALAKKNPHNAREAPKKKCNACGLTKKAGVSTA